MAEPVFFDPDLEWLDHVRPMGLVVAPALIRELGLVPERQTQADTAEAAELIRAEGAALPDPWAFMACVLGWSARHVAGAPGGPPLPDALSIRLPEHETTLSPSWAVRELSADGSPWQLLVRIEAEGVDPDARGALDGWEATAHQRFERLLRETGVFAGVLIGARELRLIHAPRGETSGWLSFPLRDLASVSGRPMLGGLKLMLGGYRLFNDADDRRLPALLRRSREAQAAVSTKLAEQVLGALHELLRGLDRAEPDLIRGLARHRPEHLYEGLLTVLMRLVFLLYAEDRDLIPSRSDAPSRALYDENYSLRGLFARLTEDSALHPDTMDERLGGWGRLLALFRLAHKGDPYTGDPDTGGPWRSDLPRWIKGRGGRLFDPDAFPVLEGRAAVGDAPRVVKVPDGFVLRLLESLMTIESAGRGEGQSHKARERLSYRTLDVEQIGSVYETVMGFTVELASGPTLAIRAGRKNAVPVFVDLEALVAKSGAARLKHLKEATGRDKFGARVEAAIKGAKSAAELAAAFAGVVDRRGSPDEAPVAAGTPILQPTDERRRTGSHYTPRSLTEPIVSHALEPVFARLGPDAKPTDILALKVCDPAMGSGAFLVEACRALGERLKKAWKRWPETRPKIPADEDEDLHARRLVAQRCLYGVDRNPRAVELAGLSLWLATLARDHEFTFLDHALKCGDSLVGLDAQQIAALHWDASKPGLPLFRQLVREKVAAARRARSEIQSAPDDAMRAIQEARHRTVEGAISAARVLGDAVLSAFFAESRPKEREKRRATIESWAADIKGVQLDRLSRAAASLGEGDHPIRPFHWRLEFPEVFERDNPGFDAIVGNPPFAGKNTIAAGNRGQYPGWQQTLHEGAHGNADLVAHFFRRAFALLREGGVFGLIATNTIGQGDTRATGLASILGAGGTILRAVRRLKWPGEAAVVVSVVHVKKGAAAGAVLDGRPAGRISAYLVEGDLDASPKRLAANARKAFIGSYVLGMGFTFDDEAAAKGAASSLEDMRRLIEKDSRNAERIFPYIGGEEVNNDPRQRHRRYVIDFGEMSEAEARGGWPDLMEIVERRVRGTRGAHSTAPWWQFERRRGDLYRAIAGLPWVLAVSCGASPHMALAFLPVKIVYAHTLAVFAFPEMSAFATLQSRIHEVWARFFASSMKDDLRYTPSDCFASFPFPHNFETSPALESAGQACHDHRAALMIARNEGLTKTYNRFHNPVETSADIIRLRELHAAMDSAVLRAYGWDDLADRAQAAPLDETNEDDHKYQGRLFWPADVRDEVLARLLALNSERSTEEARLGLTVGARSDLDQESGSADESEGGE